MNRKAPWLALACLVVSGGAHAELSIQRNTTVSDDSGGSLMLQTEASQSQAAGSSSTEANFNSFSPRDPARNIDGQISRSRTRSDESMVSIYQGSFTLSGVDADGNAVSSEWSLEGLSVSREGEGPDLGGTVSIDGTAYAADALPAAQARQLRAVLRLMHFD